LFRTEAGFSDYAEEQQARENPTFHETTGQYSLLRENATFFDQGKELGALNACPSKL
jgi:hypothetical protein